MDDIQKFKNEVENIIDDLNIVMSTLEEGAFVRPHATVSCVIDVYEDTVERLQIAFSELRESIGEKRLADLKDNGKERTDS